MPRRKIQNRNIRSLTKISGGYSYGITLPIEVIREFGCPPASPERAFYLV